MAAPVTYPGGVKIKPPFEMGVANFNCKSSDNATIGASTLYSGEIIDMIRDYEKEHPKTFFHLFRGKAEGDGLSLFVEPAGQYEKEVFKPFMEKRLLNHGIKLNDVFLLEQGAGDNAMKITDRERPKTVNTTKVQIFMK